MIKAKKHLPAALIILLLLIIFATMGGFAFTKFIKKQYNSEIYQTVTNISESKATEIDEFVQNTYKRMEDYYTLLIDQYNTIDKIEKDTLAELAVRNGFKSILISDTKGETVSSDVSNENIVALDYFKQAMDGNYYVGLYDADNNNKSVVVFCIPVKLNSHIIGVMAIFYNTKDIEGILSISELSKSGYSCIVDSKCNPIITSLRVRQLCEDKNIADVMYEASDINEHNVDRMLSEMKQRKSGRFTFYNSEKKYMVYTPLENNDWYVLVMIPTESMSKEMEEILYVSRIGIGIICVVFALTLLFIIKQQDKNRYAIERIAYVDELTGGNSFEKFKKDVDKIIRNSTNEKYAIVSIDVDKFKFINDIFGYEEGNNVIKFIWNEINKKILQGETFSHKRADQFVLLLHADDEQELISRIEELSLNISTRESQNEKNYEIVLSVGIYNVIKDQFKIDTAIDRAELTKKSIKGKHSKFYAIYDDKLRQKILRDQDIENKMEKALEKHEFKVYYQPKYDSDNCKLASAEALVRWYNESTGMIFPNEFIPVFENNGFIVELDKYMFESVCSDVRKWLDEGYEVVPVSVNLSQLQLYNLHFVDEYKDILKKYDIPPKYVQLELTETTLFSEASVLNQIIDKLHDAGFKILMDDFGTGYSSLNMLKNVPVDVLKLDKSFVDDIGEQKGNIVVSTIVSLGQSLDMKIVAEGVETKEQFEFLKDIACDEIQGYYFSRPIAEEEYRQILCKGATL